MFTLAFLKAEIAEYFEPMQPVLSKLKVIYDYILGSIFDFKIFIDYQGKRRVVFTQGRSAFALFMFALLLFYLSGWLLFLTYASPKPDILSLYVLTIIVLPSWIFCPVIIVDLIIHHYPFDHYLMMEEQRVREEQEKRERIQFRTQFNDVNGFFPPEYGDKIYEIKIASTQKDVTAKILIFNELRQESFTAQKLVREKIAAFSQGKFAENPEKYADEAKSLTEEQRRINALTKKRNADYEFARNLALHFGYQVPSTKKHS